MTDKKGKNHYRHIAFFKLYDQVNDEKLQQARLQLQRLGEGNDTILEWDIELSLDTRKGKIIVENALFENKEAFQNFRQSTKHLEAVAFMKEIADWWVGDYLEI